MTEDLNINPGGSEPILRWIREGQVFIVPTDTVFGLGASILRKDAVDRVFKLKDRPRGKSVPVLTNKETAFELGDFSTIEQEVALRYWPGALTLVVPYKGSETLPDGILRSGTIALRVPNHTGLLRILKGSPPITGTSANVSGTPPPYNRSDISDKLMDKIDFMIEGVPGGAEVSTVAEWKPGTGEWTIHRGGPISREELVLVRDESIEDDER